MPWQGDDDEDDDDGDEGYGDDDITVPCPHCGRDIVEDIATCPYCENYLSQEDRPASRPTWVIVTAIVCLLMAIAWAIPL